MRTSARFALSGCMILFAASLVAQGRPGGTSGGGSTGGNTPTTGRGTTTPPTTRMPSTMPTDEPTRPIFLTGKVVLTNGGVVPGPVAIQRVCGSTVQREAYSDARGNFSLTLGDNNFTFQDASESAPSRPRSAMGGLSRRQLWGCEIRASLAGYTSSVITLAGRDLNEMGDIGTLVLTKIGGVEGNSISVVSLRAPDKARKEYEKALEDYQKKKYADAEKRLAKAVAIYPQYATAWELRGREQIRQKQMDEARKSFQAAITADEKFVPPYIQLAVIEAGQPNWEEALRWIGKALQLDPSSYPDAHFINAVAHFNLSHYPEAERSAIKATELDKEHRFPRADLLLGNLFQMRGDHEAAALRFQQYLKYEPDSPEAARIQTYLATIQQQKAAAKR
jgi:tetratricopeptide (TPR) repeat protein